jgi:hypothetical protein
MPVENSTVVGACASAYRKHRPDGGTLVIAEFVALGRYPFKKPTSYALSPMTRRFWHLTLQ